MTTHLNLEAQKIESFAHGYFRMNGLIHDLKSLMNTPTRNLSASSLIQRECTAMCQESGAVGKASFQAIMYDYGFHVDLEQERGIIRNGNFCIVFPLI